MPTKTGTTKATITTMTTSAIAKTIAGYIIADFTWRLQGVELLELGGDPVERLLEAARALAGLHHRAVERIEDARLALHRLGAASCRPRRRCGRPTIAGFSISSSVWSSSV